MALSVHSPAICQIKSSTSSVSRPIRPARRPQLHTRMTPAAAAAASGSAEAARAGAAAAAAANFDTEAYDKERLALDNQAMDRMRQQAAAQSAALEAAAAAAAGLDQPAEGAAAAAPLGAWKWVIRKEIWDLLEARDLADFPRPVHHRIPNFKGAAQAAAQFAALPEFQAAQTVKVNPDTPQRQLRMATLSSGKVLVTPQPRLRTGFFSCLHRGAIPGSALQEACTSAGVAKYGKPVSLDDKLKVDLIVVGSVAVDPETGCRLGKGEGFAELEYGILRWMGAIDENTLVVTSVHDEQVLRGRIPADKMLEHDVPVDIIVTPTQVIHVPKENQKPKPPGILWHKLSPQKLAQIRILQQLKQRIEKEQGHLLPTGPDEVLPPLAERRPRQGRGSGNGGRGSGRRGGGQRWGRRGNSDKAQRQPQA